ncbi:hypothetical protein BGZ83_001701, partial [Gryganskiella cystojenkinii]
VSGNNLCSAINLGADMDPLFRQLGIDEAFKNASIRSSKTSMCDENGVLDFVLDFFALKPLEGAEARVITRVAAYDILLRKVPRDRVLFNKRILTMKNLEIGIEIVCSGSSRYEFDILVGADGVHSTVRQDIFKQLKEEDRLPLEDDITWPLKGICLEGQTSSLNLDQYSELKISDSVFNRMRGGSKPFTSKGLAWTVVQNLDEVTLDDTTKVTDWNSRSVSTMCDEVRHLPIPNGPAGSTLGTLIDLTNKSLISKVCFNEKVFKTWFSGRVVLLGDEGVSETTAIQDAACLANWINVLRSRDTKAVEGAFREYYEERYPAVALGCRKGQFFESLTAKSLQGTLARLIQRWTPNWLWTFFLRKKVASVFRPQVSFLPLVEDRGTVPAAPQRSLIMTLEILASHGRSVQAAVV